MKQGTPFELDRKSMKTETTIRLEFRNGGKPIVEQILAPERNKSKRAGLRESQSGTRIRKLTL